MENQNELSQSLMELSDAIEKLAMIMAHQNIDDVRLQSKQFAVLVDKFTRTTRKIAAPAEKNLSLQIKAKHQKDWLKKWLYRKKIDVGEYKESLIVDKKLSATADYLAEHYIELKDFYRQLKYQQNIRKDFVTNTPQKARKYILNWAKMLHDNKIIDAFKTLDNGKLDVDIARIHDATLFINGLWLEIYLRRELALHMRKNIDKIQTYDILAQVKTRFPDGINTEMDLLLMINEKVYWFECKSGHIGSKYYNRFKKIKQHLGLPKKRGFLVVPLYLALQKEQIEGRAGMEALFGNILPMQLDVFLKY